MQLAASQVGFISMKISMLVGWLVGWFFGLSVGLSACRLVGWLVV
jgi:hypothetical protein